jgi:HEPN domain-containing protein
MLCARAREFHATAKGALRRQQYSAFAENLFAEVELLAKGLLAMLSDERALKTTSHQFVKSELNRTTKHGNVPRRFVALHNRLIDMRPRARYGEQSFSINLLEARKMLRCARDFYRHVDQRRPRRWQNPAI